MAKFEFFGVPHIFFGRGQFSRVGELAAALGRRALIIFNGPEATVESLKAQLAAVGLACVPVRQRGEPAVADVDAALAVARDAACDMAIGLGGGSAIDAAKAVAGLLTNGGGGGVLDFMEVVGKGQKISRPAAPWIAIPCTAGTGAEATRNAVIGFKGQGKNFKASVRSELLLPTIALIDPELGVAVPPNVTASSGMDALCQCIESYTSTGANPLTDTLALEGIQRAARSLKRAHLNPADLDAREDMALAALLSGIALTNAGLGAVHGFAAPLGAAFPVPHGTVCAALLPHVLLANVSAFRHAGRDHDPVMARYLKIGGIFLGHDAPNDLKLRAAHEFPEALARDLAIPRLSTFGITPADVAPIVALARKSSSMKYNPIALSPEDLAQILSAAL